MLPEAAKEKKGVLPGALDMLQLAGRTLSV